MQTLSVGPKQAVPNSPRAPPQLNRLQLNNLRPGSGGARCRVPAVDLHPDVTPLKETLPKLQGPLLKRHQNSRIANWGQRYLRVDDVHDVIYYFRSSAANVWDEPANFFMLRSLDSVRKIAADEIPFAFELHFKKGKGGPPPKKSQTENASPQGHRSKLLLRASTELDQQRWVAGLQARLAIIEQGVRPPPPVAPSPDPPHTPRGQALAAAASPPDNSMGRRRMWRSVSTMTTAIMHRPTVCKRP